MDCDLLNWGICKAHDYWTPEWLTALSTVALAAFTLGLTIFTAFLYATTRTSSKAAAVAAKAAQDSAEALPKLERAYLFANIHPVQSFTTTYHGIMAPPPDTTFQYKVRTQFDEGLIDLPSDNPVYHLDYEVNLTNHGKTPAVIKSLRLGASHVTDAEPPESWGSPSIENEVVLRADAKRSYKFRDPTPLSKDAAQLIHDGKRSPQFYGRIEYEDVFGLTHITQFCGRYSAPTDRFELYGGRKFNFRT